MSDRKMTRERAEMIAKERWGRHAFADWFTTDGDSPTREFRVGYFAYYGMGNEVTHFMGRADTPEAALADADR